jgi:itaconate CoA-transferase
MSTPALEGILVVALEQAVAAPFCTSRLADAGARVIKIERASGDLARHYDGVAHGESVYFVWLNRGKESIALNIKDSRDAALLHAIINKADVFVQNLSPGAAKRAGFGSMALRASHPKLITCDISGYGDDGPYASMKAYDFLVQCETGLASITGSREAAARVGVSIVDIGCGMSAHAAILEALFERERTGSGRAISVSLFDVVADWMAVPLIHWEYTGNEPERAGLHHATIAPYGAYLTGDGRQIVIAVQTNAEWERLCRSVLKKPQLVTDERFSTNSERCANRSILDEEINAALSQLGYDALVGALKRASIAFGRFNTVGEFARHSQLRRVRVNTPTGPVSIPAPPQILDGEGFLPGPVPAIDQHGPAIRREFGGSDANLRAVVA